MKTTNNTLSAIVGLATISMPALAGAAQVLLNGTTITSEFAFTTFMDDTTAGTRAWSFRADGATTLSPIVTGGFHSSFAPEAVSTAGSATISFVNPLSAGITGYAWTGDSDEAARNAMTNGSGFYSDTSLGINIPVTVAPEGSLFHVELLAFPGFGANPRVFDVTANGVDRVTNWSIYPGGTQGGATFNQVLEFDVVAGATGITLLLEPGSDAGDSIPYVNALAITPIPEPSSALLLGLAGLGFAARRRRV